MFDNLKRICKRVGFHQSYYTCHEVSVHITITYIFICLANGTLQMCESYYRYYLTLIYDLLVNPI